MEALVQQADLPAAVEARLHSKQIIITHGHRAQARRRFRSLAETQTQRMIPHIIQHLTHRRLSRRAGDFRVLAETRTRFPRVERLTTAAMAAQALAVAGGAEAAALRGLME